MNLSFPIKSNAFGIVIVILSVPFLFTVGCHCGQKNLKAQEPPVTSLKKPDLLNADSKELERLAYERFANYTTGTHPVWTWSDKCGVGLLDCGSANKSDAPPLSHLEHSLEIPPQESQAPHPPNAANPILQIVYYNDAAAACIRKHKLFDHTELSKLRDQLMRENPSDVAALTVPDFDSKSVIVKTIWQPVYPMPTPIKSSPTGYHFFNFFNRTKVKPVSDSPHQTLPAIRTWPLSTRAFVDPTHPDTCERKQDSKGFIIYNLGCFYYLPVTGETVRHLPDNIGSSLLAGQCEKKTCYLLFMGMHVMTRETPDWLWMTYWWTDEGRPASVKDKWQFFDAAGSTTNQGNIANPYLEGPTNSGMDANCLDCHRFAVYNPKFKIEVGLTAAVNPDWLHAKDLLSPPCYFNASLRTHFLWTIAVHQDNSISQSNSPCD